MASVQWLAAGTSALLLQEGWRAGALSWQSEWRWELESSYWGRLLVPLRHRTSSAQANPARTNSAPSS